MTIGDIADADARLAARVLRLRAIEGRRLGRRYSALRRDGSLSERTIEHFDMADRLDRVADALDPKETP